MKNYKLKLNFKDYYLKIKKYNLNQLDNYNILMVVF
jgi:hypothetical protein